MNYFDLHCDTISKAYEEGLSLESSKLEVNLKNITMFEKYNQCFALFINDKFKSFEAERRAEELYGFYLSRKSDFEKQKNLKPILTIENCECFNERLENIELWESRKTAMATLTWNGENSLGFGSGVRSGGLKPFGFKALGEMEERGIVVDVSHLNEDGFRDVCKKAKRAFVASHSNCFSLRQHNRNLKDYQIKEIIFRGGLIGICFYPPFLGNGNVYKLVYEHIKHILSLGGEDVIAFGSDFDGARMNKKLCKIEQVKNLYNFLLKKGFEKELLEKIFFKNSEKFFNNILQLQ